MKTTTKMELMKNENYMDAYNKNRPKKEKIKNHWQFNQQSYYYVIRKKIPSQRSISIKCNNIQRF